MSSELVADSEMSSLTELLSLHDAMPLFNALFFRASFSVEARRDELWLLGVIWWVHESEKRYLAQRPGCWEGEGLLLLSRYTG